MPPVVEMLQDGRVRDEVRQVFRVMAGYDLVLATGHLSEAEIRVVVPAAVAAGMRRVVATHPEFTSQRLSVPTQRCWPGTGRWSGASPPRTPAR